MNGEGRNRGTFPLRHGGFVTVQPNLVGWLALLTPGAAVGAAVFLVTPYPPWLGAIVGAALIWRVALFLDFRKYMASDIHFQVDVANVAELDQITARLRSIGVTADGHEITNEDGATEYHLVAKHRDRAAVEKEIGWV